MPVTWCKGCKFEMKGVTYIITAKWMNLGKPIEYEFETTDKANTIKSYKISAQEFHEKVKDSNYVGI